LTEYGVSTWLDEKEMVAGDRISTKVAKAIQDQQKILLCASESSLTSWWVDNEINSAISKEQLLWKEKGKESLVIIPLNLDGYLFSNRWNSGWKDQITSRLAPDFTGWRRFVDIDYDWRSLEQRIQLIDQCGRDALKNETKVLAGSERPCRSRPAISTRIFLCACPREPMCCGVALRKGAANHRDGRFDIFNVSRY
jgi:hypothetical protein